MHYKSNVALKREVDEIIYDVRQLKKELVEGEPEHFSKKDVLRSFFGALIVGFSFLFSSNLINITKAIRPENMWMIVVSTIVFLNAEIYFIGYSRVRNKQERKYLQFFFKRMLTFYAIAFVTAFYLSTIYGLLYFIGSMAGLLKLSLVMAMPCAIGAAIADLLKKY